MDWLKQFLPNALKAEAAAPIKITLPKAEESSPIVLPVGQAGGEYPPMDISPESLTTDELKQLMSQMPYQKASGHPKGIEVQQTKMKILKNPKALSRKILGPEE
jgi:hypothetical protein